jgi:hypothetical protein
MNINDDNLNDSIEMIVISQELSIKKRPKSSFKISSDPVTNSPKKLSMKSSALSIRITPVPSRRMRWLFSSSNSSEETESFDYRSLKQNGAIIFKKHIVMIHWK